MDTRLALAELVEQLISLALSPLGAGFFVLPLLMLRWIIRFLRWGIAVARSGDNLEEMQAEWSQQQQRIRQAPERTRSTFRRRF